ncbi:MULTISPECIES: hypothetical protein [Stenotrophomonas maltophilia group]|uniref:hypothetical protein n=1 Tax=Stenotrophomonas TaxID=40323 RepID=UPI00118017E7|nr:MULTISPECIES: hypothetical protein [Stenotrophomonas maltophilia group]MCO7485967.1 hypothetical protein [Stenotrophomonas maltophilia]MCZ7845325.1 hypothetical protein [Stenotrophomonas maltophilia]MDJ1625754.1 hypothetical protein [Stenotrophomonas sepilia]UXB36006.1 hypothetical protein K7563_19115 [Stenotrophomonas maltophilia]
MKVVVKPGAESARGWLCEDAEVTVLALMISPSGEVRLVLWSDAQESVALFPIGDFSVSDSTLSVAWVISFDPSGAVSIAPKSWQTADFWDLYNEGDSAAEEIFRLEMKRMMDE